MIGGGKQKRGLTFNDCCNLMPIGRLFCFPILIIEHQDRNGELCVTLFYLSQVYIHNHIF